MLKLKRKRQKKQNRGLLVIKKSIAKILATLLMVSLNWTGLLAIGRTFAYFNDIENSPENIYQAGTLDFVLETPGDFSLNFKANETAVRDINIINEGSLLFKYIVEGADFSGPLCERINLEATLDGETKYDGVLTSFALAPPVDFSEPTDNWTFIFSFSGDVETYKNTPCQFYLDFKGWQDNAADYDSSGFKDLERAFVRLTLRQEKTIVLNEFLPNPEGDECGREGILGEWVEIYNNSEYPVDLAGWYIKNAGAAHTIVIDNSNTLSGSTVIRAKGSGSEWLVVFLNNCILNNDGGDTVSLYDDSGYFIDSYSYSGSAPENKSYARYPDGTGPWYDPIPTPGGPNVLGIPVENNFQEENIKNGDGEESSEEIFNEASEEDVIINLPEVDVIETATPSMEEVIVMRGQEEEEVIEEVAEEPEKPEEQLEQQEELEQPQQDERLEQQLADVPDNDLGQVGEPGNDGGESDRGDAAAGTGEVAESE